jgi:hypothetical protein
MDSNLNVIPATYEIHLVLTKDEYEDFMHALHSVIEGSTHTTGEQIALVTEIHDNLRNDLVDPSPRGC